MLDTKQIIFELPFLGGLSMIDDKHVYTRHNARYCVADISYKGLAWWRTQV